MFEMQAWRVKNREHIKAYNKTYRAKNTETIKKYLKVYYTTHIEESQEQAKAWRLEHPEERRNIQKRWHLAHLEEERARKRNFEKNYRILHPELIKKRRRKYCQTPKGKEQIAKNQAKRKRQFGFTILNKSFPNSHGHHINREEVIYVPAKLHESISHSVLRNRNMEVINRLAFEFLSGGESENL